MTLSRISKRLPQRNMIAKLYPKHQRRTAPAMIAVQFISVRFLKIVLLISSAEFHPVFLSSHTFRIQN
jgi:hypothetical protein